MKLRFFPILAFAAGMICFTACKPTEAGYKAAYDSARDKRLAEQQEDAALYGGMIRDGEPRWRYVGADSVQFVQQPLAPLEGDSLPVRNVNVAVASYRMPTNAKAHAQRLSNSGLDSRVLKTSGSSFLVIAAQYDSIAPAPTFIKEYMRRHPDDMYAGLSGRPIVTAPSGRRIK